MTYNQANIKGGILVTCSCNFVFGMQVVSTKELQRTLAIRSSLNGRSSKRNGKGISEARSGLGTSPLSVWMREAHADAVAGGLTTNSLSFFLVPRAKWSRNENGLTKSEEKERLLAIYTSRKREAWQKGSRGVMGRRRTKGRESPLPSLPFLALLPLIALLFNRRPRDNWGQVSATNSHLTADETQGVTRPCLYDQRFSI